jgi:hypothetical protein
MTLIYQLFAWIFSGALFISLYEIFLNLYNLFIPIGYAIYYILTLITYLINALVSNISVVFILFSEFFLTFLEYLSFIPKAFDYMYQLWNKLIEIFYTTLGYITGIIAFIFDFAQTGGEEIFSV